MSLEEIHLTWGKKRKKRKKKEKKVKKEKKIAGIEDKQRCIAITGLGTRCTRRAVMNNRCKQHQKK